MGDGRDAYWVIYGQELFDALTRVADGDDPEIVFIELYANSEREDYSQ